MDSHVVHSPESLASTENIRHLSRIWDTLHALAWQSILTVLASV